MALQMPSVPSADAMVYHGIFKSQYKTSTWGFYKVKWNYFSSSVFGFLAPLQLLLSQLLPLGDLFHISGKPFSFVISSGLFSYMLFLFINGFHNPSSISAKIQASFPAHKVCFILPYFSVLVQNSSAFSLETYCGTCRFPHCLSGTFCGPLTVLSRPHVPLEVTWLTQGTWGTVSQATCQFLDYSFP